jgi:hypothetical protein
MKLAVSVIFALTLLAFTAAYSFDRDSPIYRGGLCNSNGNRSFNSRQLQSLLESLRRKTGFLEMRFDQAGCLTLGDLNPSAGGSPTARELLTATVEGDRLFMLESHNRSPNIEFARLSASEIFQNHRLKTRVEVRLVDVDFADFYELRGGDEVLESFDIGFSILHELAHGVWRLRDAVGDQDQVGSCEESVNRMRRELGLPERQSYRPNVYVIRKPWGAVLEAELLFVLARRESGRVRERKFYLRWDTDKVTNRDNSSL